MIFQILGARVFIIIIIIIIITIIIIFFFLSLNFIQHCLSQYKVITNINCIILSVCLESSTINNY